MIPTDYIAPEDRKKSENVGMSFSEAMRLIFFGRRVKLPEWGDDVLYKSTLSNDMPLVVKRNMSIERYCKLNLTGEQLMREDWMEA